MQPGLFEGDGTAVPESEAEEEVAARERAEIVDDVRKLGCERSASGVAVG